MEGMTKREKTLLFITLAFAIIAFIFLLADWPRVALLFLGGALVICCTELGRWLPRHRPPS